MNQQKNQSSDYADPRRQHTTFHVWLPESHAGIDSESLHLLNPQALQFFLEALYRGHALVGDQPFGISAYQGTVIIGSGTYHVYFPDVSNAATQSDPVTLIVVSEHGEIVGVLQDAWQEMLKRVKESQGQG